MSALTPPPIGERLRLFEVVRVKPKYGFLQINLEFIGLLNRKPLSRDSFFPVIATFAALAVIRIRGRIQKTAAPFSEKRTPRPEFRE